METARTYFADEGEALQEFSYDAWGNSRDPYTWRGTNTTHCMFDRGFTGHEMLYDFGLINMNGRMYDPVMSSFLSVDRYVQNPSNSQSFNRYSYCLNNPLKYTDPSGWQMVGGNTPKPFSWSYGDNVSYEPRDLQYNSPYMTSCFLSGGDGSLGAGGGGGGFAGTYGYIVANSPYYINNNFYVDKSVLMRAPTVSEAVKAWWNDPSFETRQALVDAGISELNVGVLEQYGLKHGKAIIEVGGKKYSLPLPTLDVGRNDFYIGVIAPDIDLTPNAGSGLLGLQKANNRTYETIGTDPGVLRGIGDGIRSLTLAAVDFEKASKTVKVLGKGITHASYLGDAISLEIAWHNYRVNRTYENKARLIVTAIGIGVNGLDFFVPGLGTVCSIAVFAIDADGGFDNFYYKYGRE